MSRLGLLYPYADTINDYTSIADFILKSLIFGFHWDIPSWLKSIAL